MFRLATTLGLVLVLCVSTGVAGERKAPTSCAGLDVDAMARLILEEDGPQQTLVAQALRDADRGTLLEVQKAVRKLAPVIAKEAAARAPEPDPQEMGDGPADLVNIEVRFLEASDNFLRDVGVDSRGHKGAPGEAGARESGGPELTFLDDLQVEVILRAVEKSSLITQLTAPRITVYDRQLANVSLLNQKSFVADAERVDLGGGTFAAKPKLERAHEGVVLTLRPTLSADRRYVTIESSLLTASLVAPASRKSVVCAGKRIDLTMPTTSLRMMRSTVRIPSAGTVLISQAAKDGGKALLTLITARHIQLTDLEIREAAPVLPKDGERKPAGK